MVRHADEFAHCKKKKVNLVEMCISYSVHFIHTVRNAHFRMKPSSKDMNNSFHMNSFHMNNSYELFISFDGESHHKQRKKQSAFYSIESCLAMSTLIASAGK